MKAETFAKSIDELYERLKKLTVSKGEEYKRREDNQFANFERGAQALGLTREQVLMVYLSKHLDSITTYVKDRAAGQERQYAEPITGRIDDAILYLLLLRGMAVDNASCRCIDCGGDQPEHSSQCEYMAELHDDPLTGAHGSRAVYEAEGFKFDSDPVVVVSRSQPAAAEECQARALPMATSCLTAVDQLHGLRPGGHVVFVHHGNGSDDAMLAEVKARCVKQGLTCEVVYK